MNRRVSFGLGISSLVVLALLGGAATSPAASKRGPLPAPSLRPSPAWFSVTTGSSNIPTLAPSVWAVTARSNPAALAPFDFPQNLRHLSRNAVYVWATTAGRGGPDFTFKRAEWPLRLSRFRLDHAWEGQPAPNVQQRLRWAAVHGWRLDVRVYYATQHPGKQLLRAAQQELNRLLLPSLG
jgi:hypothetical protein